MRRHSAPAKIQVVLVWLALAAVLPACSRFDGLAFREDTRVDIVAPQDRARVQLPVTIRWTSETDAYTYGVYVDRAPQPPGETLAWFARNDEVCRVAPACPDPAYLEQRNVFRTDRTSFVVRQLLDTQRETQRREFHEVTIALLDGQGRRVGESAWSVEFQVERRF